MDSAGDTTAVWRAATPLTMQAASFDIARPELSSVSVPPLDKAIRPDPRLAIADRLVTVRNGRAHLGLRCPGTTACHGSARLTRQVSEKGRRHPRLIAETDFAIPAGAQMTVTTKLNSKGLNLFLAAGKIGLRAQLTGDAVESRTVVLKPVAPRPNSH